MKIYCVSDIHGCLTALQEALERIGDLRQPDVKLVLLGDYVHGGEDNRGVLDCIIRLQERYGTDKVIALAGNHDRWVVEGIATVDYMIAHLDKRADTSADAFYEAWLDSLPLYHVEGNTIFVHAGIDEEAGEWWEWVTFESVLTDKFPVETGLIQDFPYKIVAGHVGTSEISGNRLFHDIFYDGGSHYYIDGTVLDTGVLNVLMVDTDTDRYYRITDSGAWLILPYDEEH